jgi:hypothetical protein
MPVVRDLAYLAAEDTEADHTHVSDPGTGEFPIVRDYRSHVAYHSSATTVTRIPLSRVISLVDTTVP